MPTPVRRVIVGTNAEGKSLVVSDEIAQTVLGDDVSPVVLVELWKTFDSPTAYSAKAADGTDGEGFIDPVDGPIIIAPGPTGSLFRICEFPPMSKVTKSWNDAFEAMGQPLQSDEEHDSDGGYHATDTIDYIVVLDGEITCCFEAGEVTIKAGDTFVQRGTKHAWENRSDKPCRFTSILVGAFPR